MIRRNIYASLGLVNGIIISIVQDKITDYIEKVKILFPTGMDFIERVSVKFQVIDRVYKLNQVYKLKSAVCS